MEFPPAKNRFEKSVPRDGFDLDPVPKKRDFDKDGKGAGATSKASAVLQSGDKYFLVPTAQGEEDIANARKVVGDQVEISPVAPLDEALAALKRIGGDPLPAAVADAPVTTDSTP
jgi:hypothetical protein